MSENVASTRALAGVVFVGFLVAGCDRGATVTEPLSGALHNHAVVAATSPVAGAGNALVKELHSLASRFHSTKQAENAGYAADPVCVEVPALGGMGHHWANTALVDPVFDATQPEVMLYAPTKNGKLELVAVEYIVVNTGQARPSFDGHLFDVGGAPIPVAHWTLHVWIGKPNPSGLFAPFNPDVDCP